MDYAALRQKLDDETIEFVDLRAADFVGRLRHVTLPASRFTEDLVRRGVGFDASNYGYCDVAGSDRVLIPDLETAYFEEHDGERILVLIASIYDAGTGEPAPCDPRRIARRAEDYLRETEIADEILFSPEFEFYVFEEALFESRPGRTSAELVPLEGREHCDHDGPQPNGRSAYHAPLHQDRLFSLRCEMVR